MPVPPVAATSNEAVSPRLRVIPVGCFENENELFSTSPSDTAVLVPPALVAVRLTVNVPAAVGVPVIAPVLVFRLRPLGSPLAAYDVGLLLATTWYEKAVPTTPVALVALVIAGATGATGGGVNTSGATVSCACGLR